MEKTKLLGLALIATMTSFSACTNDAEEVLAQKREIKLTSEIIPSRVASLDYQTTQIVTGQQVGVTITGIKEGQEHNNIPWLVGDNGALTNTGDAVYYGDGAATITAYHPFNYDWDESTTYPFSVSTDQTDAANYLNSDLLWATATSSKTETPISLVFTHKLAKINVTIVPEENETDLNGAIISIYNTKISTTFNPTTGEISDAAGDAQEIIAGITAADAYTASAIVVPQEVSGKFIKIIHEGKTYYYTLDSAKELESGHSYSYTLTVKGNQLISTGSSIDEWDDENDNIGDAEEENNIDGENNSGSKTVNNIIAGGLGSLLTQKEKETLTSLTITGKLNSDDIRLIREMAGGQFSLHTSPSSDGKLTVLDITNCKIVKGGSAFVQKDETTSYYTDDNSLGENTFAYTNLKEVYLPTSVIRLRSSMFGYTNISKLIIPDCVEEIAGYLFWDNDALTSIDLPANLKSGYTGLFHGCKNLETITIEASNTRYKVIDGVLYLDEYILYCCPAGKTTVTVKDGTTCFTYESFSNSKISELTIPSSVVELASSIFRGCKNLVQIKMESSTPPRATEFSGNGTEYSAFDMFDNMENCKLLVPAGSKDEYSSAAGWKDFSNIEEYQE